MDATEAIRRACAAVGGQAEMARSLVITPGAVSQWCLGTREVPAERCPAIERLTRAANKPVTCEELRPDVEWGVLRDKGGAVATAEQGG